MYKCPKCGSPCVRYSRTKTLLDRWRRRVTGKRPYRCGDCRTRAWDIDSGPRFVPESIELASRAIAADPPDLKLAGLSRQDRDRAPLDLDDLDTSLHNPE